MAGINFNEHYVLRNNNNEWFVALPVPGDGSCFFHSISHFVGENAQIIRKKCVELIKEQQIFFQNFFSDNGTVDMHFKENFRVTCLGRIHGIVVCK